MYACVLVYGKFSPVNKRKNPIHNHEAYSSYSEKVVFIKMYAVFDK